MLNKELRKLNRTELLQILVDLSEENEVLKQENASLKEELGDKIIHIENAGSIAEASLVLSGIFEDAQKAAEQYLHNVRCLSDVAQASADALMERVQKKCSDMEADAQRRCDEYVAEAKRKADEQWASLKARLDSYCQAHESLKDQLENLYPH